MIEGSAVGSRLLFDREGKGRRLRSVRIQV